MTEHHQEKLSLMQDLIQLSEVDNHVDFMEENFIITIANGLGISSEEVTQLKENPVSFNPQENEMDRITHFYRLLLLMGVDSEHHEKEIQFCKEVGLKMGLNPVAMREIIERIVASETHQLPPNEIIKIFKTHHN